MSCLTDEQIRREFERQVHLCSGLGREQMVSMVNEYFDLKGAKLHVKKMDKVYGQQYPDTSAIWKKGKR